MEYRIVDCLTDKEKNDCRTLLASNGLTFEEKVDKTIALYDGEQMVATGSIYENVIKMIAVEANYQGENLTSIIMFNLISILNQKNISKYFIFTKPESKKYFIDFNFSEIIESEHVVMLENSIDKIEDQLNQIKNNLKLKSGKTSGIVMNCNPVTLGHMYLIERCANESDNVIVFLVEENKSVFPFEIRLNLLKKATKHWNNVHIVPSTKYIISSATFPTYFLKELNQASLEYMKLDISIFNKYFMKIFSLDKRYVGSEPLDPTTSAYNQTMKEILGEKLVEIERVQLDSNIVSASFVRKLAKELKYDELKKYVPNETYKFLKSPQGRKLFYEQ